MTKGEKIRELLQRERDGLLSEQEQSDVAFLRERGGFPEPLAGPPTPPPTSFTDTFRHYADKVTGAVAPFMPTGGTPAMEMTGRRGGPPLETPEAVEGRQQAVAGTQRTMAESIVPQTPMQAGMMLGTLGGAGVAGAAGMRPLAAAATRIGGGALGGEVGNQIEGGQTGRGALVGGASTAVSETVSAVIGKVLRSAQPAAISRADAKRIGEAVDDVAPTLAGARTPADLQRMALDKKFGDNKLSAAYRAKVDEAISYLPVDPATQVPERLVVPALKPIPASTQGGEVGMTLPEAIKALSDLGHGGFGGVSLDPAGRTITGRAKRELWETAIGQVESELSRLDPSGRALAAFQAGRHEYAAGSAVLTALRKSGAFIARPREVLIDTAKLQRYVSEHRSLFQNRLTPDEWATFARAVYRGGDVGTGDIVARTYGAADAASQLARSGGGTGTVAVLGPRTLLPGLGNQYAGDVPFQLGAVPQTILDLVTQRAASPSQQGGTLRDVYRR